MHVSNRQQIIYHISIGITHSSPKCCPLSHLVPVPRRQTESASSVKYERTPSEPVCTRQLKSTGQEEGRPLAKGCLVLWKPSDLSDGPLAEFPHGHRPALHELCANPGPGLPSSLNYHLAALFLSPRWEAKQVGVGDWLRVCIPALPFTSWMTLDNLFHFSVPRFLHL